MAEDDADTAVSSSDVSFSPLELAAVEAVDAEAARATILRLGRGLV